MATDTKSKPAWVELATDDPAASREFYSRLLGWDLVVSDDPQYGGYAMARLSDGEADVAGITAKMMPEAPTAWSLYIGTDDAAALCEAVKNAGGTVLAPAFDVGDMGRMAVFADPTGAVDLGLAGSWAAPLPHRRRRRHGLGRTQFARHRRCEGLLWPGLRLDRGDLTDG